MPHAPAPDFYERARGGIATGFAGLLLTCLVAACVSLTACGRTPSPEEAATHKQAELRAKLLDIFKEPTRADRIQGMIDEWRRNLADHARTNNELRQQLDALNANFETPRAAFTQLYEQRLASEEAFMQTSLAFRDRLSAEMTTDEWDRFTKLRAELRTASKDQP